MQGSPNQPSDQDSGEGIPEFEDSPALDLDQQEQLFNIIATIRTVQQACDLAWLPPPVGTFELAGGSLATHRRVVEALSNFLWTILQDSHSCDGYEFERTDTDERLTGTALRDHLALVFGNYYGRSMTALVAADPDIRELPGVPSKAVRHIAASMIGAVHAESIPLATIVYFVLGVELATAQSRIRRLGVEDGNTNTAVLYSLQTLTRIALYPTSAIGGLAAALSLRLVNILTALSKYDESFYKSRTPHPYLTERAVDFTAIARREPRAQATYGSRLVSRVYEEQLSVLCQSLGFIVVAARAGDRAADLLCFAADSVRPYVFLLEAKTSSKPYALPTKDSRALEEYVGTIRARLTTLPPLHFVLISGPQPAPLIADRLRDLEGRIGIPIRYCSADILLRLRRSIPGPVPSAQFREEILRRGSVIDEGFPGAMTKQYAIRQQAHTDLVRLLMGLQGDNPAMRTPPSP
jgi:hypothetical protein